MQAARHLPSRWDRTRHMCTACLIASAGTALPAGATTFSEAYAAARGHDPQYRAALHELESTRQIVPIARAALLPAAALNIARTDYSGTRSFANALSQEVKTDVAYAAPQASISVRMPLFNMDAQRRHEQAKVQVEGAEWLYRQRGHELLDRLGLAYMQNLLAWDNVELAAVQLRSAKGLFERAEQRFKRGEGTRTEVAQAQAALEMATVQAIEAKDLVSVAVRAYKRVTGQDPDRLNRPSASGRPAGVEPESLIDWLELAARQSPQIQARAQAAMAARLGVSRQTAGHYPRVDLVAGMSRNTNESITNLNQTSVLSSLGVQVSVPLFSGGGVDASVKQALADQARAEAELVAARQAIESEVERQFLAARNGALKIDATARAVAANEVALTGASRALDNGMGTTSDVLDAQAKLNASRRDLAQARYDHLMARLRLMAAAGTPLDELVAELDRLLPDAAVAESSRTHTTATAATRP